MLRIYELTYWVSIDHKEWEQVGWTQDVMEDDAPNEVMILDQMSFEGFYELLQNKFMGHIKAGKTLIKKKPKISIDYDFDYTRHYTHFDTISYKATYKEIKDTTFYDIIRTFPTDQCIQYLKERGMTACPILK